MTTETVKDPRDEDKEVLKEYLGLYYNCKKRKCQLEKRLKEINRELKEPIGGVGYSPVPRSNTNKVGDGAASILLRMAEIEERIAAQKDEMEMAMLKIMDIMDFLPETSTERMIMEYRHIDCMPWKLVIKSSNLTRTPCNDYYNAGITKLLEFKRVQMIIAEYKAAKLREQEQRD